MRTKGGLLVVMKSTPISIIRRNIPFKILVIEAGSQLGKTLTNVMAEGNEGDTFRIKKIIEP